MALLAEPRYRALDNSGNAISGATLTVYETGTSTPAELYSTRALALAAGGGDLANPLTADSAGYFATVFIESDAIVDVIVKDDAGTTLYQSNGVTGISDVFSSLDIDFGDDGRVRLDGANGVVNLEFGDPEGDNSGGDGRIGGWNDTEGTNLEIEFASVTATGDWTIQGNVEVDGTIDADGEITMNGGKGVDYVYSSGNETASGNNMDIALPSAFDYWEVEFFPLAPGGVTDLTLRFSYDNASTFKAGASDYTAKTIGASSATGTSINLATTAGTLSSGLVRLMIYGPAAQNTFVTWQGAMILGAGGAIDVAGGGRVNTVYGKPSHLRLIANTGFTATVRIRSRKTS